MQLPVEVSLLNFSQLKDITKEFVFQYKRTSDLESCSVNLSSRKLESEIKEHIAMEALNFDRKYFEWISVFPSAKNLSLFSKCLRKMIAVCIVFLNLTSFIASIFFVRQSKTADMEAFLYGLFQIATFGAGLYLYMTTLLLRRRMQELFLKFNQFHGESELFDSSYYYVLLYNVISTNH